MDVDVVVDDDGGALDVVVDDVAVVGVSDVEVVATVDVVVVSVASEEVVVLLGLVCDDAVDTPSRATHTHTPKRTNGKRETSASTTPGFLPSPRPTSPT